MLKLSSRLEKIQESSTLKMNQTVKELVSQGVKVINLTTGEPDFPILSTIKEAAISAIRSDFSKYTQVSGILELRTRISKKFKDDNSLEYSPDEIIVTSGAKQAIYNFLLSVLNPGDEVLIPSPYWVSYPEMAKLADGVPVFLETTSATEFKITPEQLKKSITPKTKVLVLNSPSNPTGMVYSKAEFKKIADVLEGSDVWVVSDEIYEKIVYENEFCSFASVSQDAFNRTLTVNGFSKTFAMTGWRLGYAAGPKALISAMAVLQGQSTSNANSVAQKAALTALEVSQSEIAPMVEAFKRRRNKMAQIFSANSTGSKSARDTFCSFLQPQGAFYFFLNIEGNLGKQYNHDEVLGSSEDLAFYLLSAAHVGTVAGKGFGADGYLRLSFAVSDREVEEGATRIVEALKKLR